MRSGTPRRVILAAVLAGAVTIVALANDGSAVSSALPTETIVRPVYKDVNYIDIRVEAAIIELDRAAKAKTAAKRGELREEAATDLNLALKDLKELPDPLPSIVDSRFSRTQLEAIRAHVARARRSVTSTNGAAAARREAMAARRQLRLLLDYLGLTVIRIRATFAFPVTSYWVETYDHGGPYAYAWSNTNDCGDFSLDGDRASWSHPHSDEPGACPAEPVHPATIEVVVKHRGFTCRGRYQKGSAAGLELRPAVDPCTAR